MTRRSVDRSWFQCEKEEHEEDGDTKVGHVIARGVIGCEIMGFWRSFRGCEFGNVRTHRRKGRIREGKPGESVEGWSPTVDGYDDMAIRKDAYSCNTTTPITITTLSSSCMRTMIKVNEYSLLLQSLLSMSLCAGGSAQM